MYDFNSNDINIIRSIMDKDTKRGICRAKGTTIPQIEEKTNLSTSKIRASIRKLKEKGWVDEAIKVVNTKSYYVTAKGVSELKELSSSVLKEEK